MSERAHGYQKLLQLAEGGMGTIELAVRREAGFERLFAIKRPHQALAGDATVQAMFTKEARLAGLIASPHVVAVLDVGLDSQGAFMVMEYVDGVSAATLITQAEPRDEPLPVTVCLTIAAHVARGLHAAHDLCDSAGRPLGTVHRDVSPQNILIGFDGVARVTDFGVAKAMAAGERTAAGVMKGKVGYMAPEQLRLDKIDRRADLFALGVVLYELLARARLYREDDDDETVRRILHEPPPDIGETRDDVPAEVAELLFQLLAKDRDTRPANALAVAQRLEAALALLAVEHGPPDVVAFMAEHLGAMRTLRKAAIAAAVAGLDATPVGSARRRRLRRVAGASSLALLGAVAVAWGILRPARPLVAMAGPSIWAGSWHTCARRGQGLGCWGKNHESQLGDTTTNSRTTQRVFDQIKQPISAMAAGDAHTCVLAEDGGVACWGRNVEGQLAARVGERSKTPVSIGLPGRARALSAGRNHTCALLDDARVACWGGNQRGQLGVAPAAPAAGPVVVPDLTAVTALAAGGDLTCASTRAGVTVCFGFLAGPASHSDDVIAPHAIDGAPTLVELAVGHAFACGRDSQGGVWCFGENDFGQLGDGTRVARLQAGLVTGLPPAVQIAAGASHLCARHADGSVSCWGMARDGQLGDGQRGPVARSTRAVKVHGVVDAVWLALGRQHACVRQRDGGVACWGQNDNGQLGNGTTEHRAEPVSAVGFP